MTRMTVSTAAAAALLAFAAPSGHDRTLAAPAAAAQEFDNAPWCAVLDMGDGDVTWECEYKTVEECVPNVLAGNRGFCELNPYGGHATATAASAARVKHRSRRVVPPT